MITDASPALGEGNTSCTGGLAGLAGCIDVVVEATGTGLDAFVVMENIIDFIAGGTV